MKEKAKTALAVVAIIAAGAILVEALRFFLWMCYYAGIPM